MSEQEVGRYSDKNKAPENFQRVESLKAKVRERYPDRVRQYSVDWDSDKNRPIGLADFGKQVLEDLWSELQQDLAKQPEFAGWRGEESYLLDTFIEDHAQTFIERGDVVEQVMAATSLDAVGSNIPGMVIVADSGAGKSALFATVVQKLVQANETLVLAHSAGISSRSISVSNMLQRWCALLAASLDVEDESEKRVGPDELKNYFLSLLRAASSHRRVVVLIDALDQFERTSQAMYMAWLPTRGEWPRNATLVATTTPGTEYEVLSTRGPRTLELPALSEKESTAIAARICADFHKSLPPAVLEALIAKILSDGRRAVGNPLWLTLAVNELIVLDEDDFAQLPQFSGTAEQRIVQLMTHVVGLIPPDVAGAYDYLYARLEKTYGDSFVPSLMGFLAIARFGLRESDLQALTPAASGVVWQPSSFAAVRRALRAQLSERGRSGQWAFTHLQARLAAVNRYGATPHHCDLARHLMSLPSGDPLRHETMFHLLSGGAQKEAGTYWIEAENDEELPAAYAILREHLLSSDHPGDTVSFILSFLPASFDRPDQDAALVFGHMAGERLLRFTEESKLSQADPEILRDLLNGIIDYMRKRLRDHPGSAFEETVLYRALQNLGRLETEQGELDAALRTLQEAGEINDRHAAGRKRAFEHTPKSDKQARYAKELFYHENERDRMLNFQRIAQVHIAKNERESARTSYEQALEIARYFLQRYPASELAAADMAMNLYSLGDLALEKAQFEPAAEQYAEGLKLVLAAAEKEPTPRLATLGITGHLGVARAYVRLFRLKEAIQHYALAVKDLREGAQRDPGDLSLQWRFLHANDEAADLFGLIHMRDGIEGAMQCYDNSLNTCLTMVGTGVRTQSLFEHLQRCYEQKAVIAEILGSFALAQTLSDHARDVAGWMQESDAAASPSVKTDSSHRTTGASKSQAGKARHRRL
jgi:tetratricopeptide (TPR) repeat protein